MLWPLLLMGLAYTFFYFTMLLIRVRNQILVRERNAGWLAEALRDGR